MIPLPTVDVLDAISIPVTCPVSWNAMRGDRRTRYCDSCRQNVHDVSELTTAEAVRLVTGGETVPCLRLFRRRDGRVMTADCMTKRERVWKWLHRRSAGAAALFAILAFGCGKQMGEAQGGVCDARENAETESGDLPVAPPPHEAAVGVAAPAPHEPATRQ
jgi:hypothetical protein